MMREQQQSRVAMAALLVAVLLGLTLRLVWLEDMEYKGDEAYIVARVHNAGVSETWPSLGMPSSVGMKNPAASVWAFLLPAKLLGLKDPVALAGLVACLAMLAIAGVVAFARLALPAEQREPWLWAAALAALSTPTILNERKIWAQSILPAFSLLLVMSWWYRQRFLAAFFWGLLGMLVGQIHMSGFFFTLGLFLWTVLFNRRRPCWRAFAIGSVVGLLPMLPWIVYLLQGHAPPAPAAARGWLGVKFYILWATQMAGFEDLFYLLGPHFTSFVAGPYIGHYPTFGTGACMGLLAVILCVLLGKAALIAWRQRHASWVVLTGQHSQTTLLLGAALVGFGLLLTLFPVRIFRYYLIVTFPLTFLWLAQVALAETRVCSRRTGRVLLTLICLANVLLTCSFLVHIHRHQGAAGMYGVAYAAQGPFGTSPRPDPTYDRAAAPRAGSVTITVRADETSGRVGRVLRPSFFTFAQVPPEYLQNKILRELRLGTIEVDLGREVLENARDVDDVLIRLSVVEPFLRKASAAGADVVLGFSKVPRFLSARPNDNTPALPGDTTPTAVVSPPRDYKQWTALMASIATYFKQRQLRPHYKIGWEPDTRNWQGTEEEFFELYRASVLGIKRVDAEAPVGGPGVISAGPHWKKGAAGPSMLEAFIAYAARTPLREAGMERLPLDFLAFHYFDSNPVTSASAATGMIRRWLTQHGYSPKTPLFIGEWSDVGTPFSVQRDEPYIAAFVAASMISMERAGISGQALTSLTEQQTKDGTQFCGGFGVFTKDFLPRPSYQALRALSMLPGGAVATASSDPWVFVTAARDERRTVALIANYVPTPPALLRILLDRLVEKGRSPAEVARYLQGDQAVAAYLRGQSELRNAPPDLAADLNAIRAELQRHLAVLQPRAQAPARVTVQVVGTFTGPYVLREYRIDAEHSNPARRKAELDRAVREYQRQHTQPIHRHMEEALRAAGSTPQDAALVRRVAGAGDINAALAQLAPEERRKALHLIRLVITHAENATGAMAQALTQRPEFGLEQTAHLQVTGSGAITHTVAMDANAIVVLVLERSPTQP